MKQSLEEFIDFAMRQGYEIAPYEKRILEQLTEKKFQFSYWPDGTMNKKLRWLAQLVALKDCWKNGESIAMFSPAFCTLSKPEIIYDDLIIIDDRDEEMIKGLKCDKCDKLATSVAMDEMEIVDNKMYREWVPFGDWRHGCDDHLVESHSYSLDDPDYPS